MRLGPFELRGRAGEGGSASVWHAVHAATGVPVAVKVLHGRYANDPRLRRAFDAEIRALAGLEHRAVATILDFGEVGRDEAVAAGGAVPVGAPWFAMERASGGALTRVADAPELRGVLAEVLEALAHAHARGVLHRDLKPANLLIRTASDARPGVMVADWGIAHLLAGPPADGTQAAGTAWFAAPEQVDGQWRAFGPWTDLYALGATAWALASGKPPRTGTLDPSAARFPIDDALVAWIRRLLAPTPADRYPSAAEARAALPGAAQTRVGRWPLVPPLLAASLPLFPLRRPGLVGRSAARRRLAGVLRAVTVARRARVAALVGPPGAGRSAVLDGWVEAVDAAGLAAVVALGRGGDPLARHAPLLGTSADVDPVWAIATLARHRSVVVTIDPADPALAPIARALATLAAPIAVIVVGGGPGWPTPDVTIDVPPLSPRALARVVAAWLPLQPPDALRVAVEAGGYPRRARERLERDVRLGRVDPSGARWTLSSGPEPAGVADLGPVDPVTAAVVATLGPGAPPERVIRVARAAGAADPERALDGVARLGWFDGDAALAAVADPARLFAACADDEPDPASRASHWRRAGRPDLAVAVVDAALQENIDAGRFEQVLRLLEQREAAAGSTSLHRRLRLHALLHVGALGLAEREAEALTDAAEVVERADALRVTAIARMRAGRGEVEAPLLAALEASRGMPLETNVLLTLVDLHSTRDLAEAERWLDAFRALATHPSDRAIALERGGRMAHLRGQPERARELLEAALAHPGAEAGAIRGAAIQLGELARERGDLDAADRWYRRAVDGLGWFESGELLLNGLLNLAVVALERGQPAVAREWLVALDERCVGLPGSGVHLVDLVTAAAAAALGDLEEVDARLARVWEARGDPMLRQPDSVVLLERIADTLGGERGRLAGRLADALRAALPR